MPRGKTTGQKIRFQCRSAAAKLDRALTHLMAADVVAKGGVVGTKGILMPAGVDLNNPLRDGHPVLNEYLPDIIALITATRDAITRLVKKL